MNQMNQPFSIQEDQIITGPLFNEPMRVETAHEGSSGSWTVGLVGTQTDLFRKVTLTAEDLTSLTFQQPGFSYDGDGKLLRLGLQAYMLGIAWEFDPYFGLSISRVDPLPHQLEAVYDYLLEAGLHQDRLTVKGWGKSKPLVENTSKEARTKNRRVELGIVNARVRYTDRVN